MERIVLTTGGTGGHIFPALAVAEEIRRMFPGARILFVGGDKGPEAELAAGAGLEFAALHARGVLGRGVRALAAPFWIARSMAKALRLLRDFDPDAVVGFGGYASFVPVLAGRILGVPTAIQEQNSRPGMVNRILGRLVDKVFVSFPDDRGVFSRKKTLLAGNPVRSAIAGLGAADGASREAEDRPAGRVLVLGGSQGARGLNEAMLQAAPALAASGVTVLHHAGRREADRVRESYAGLGIGENAVRVEAFIEDVAEAYAWADLVVCRAGATTVAEVAVAGKPCIFVPFPYATHDHQTYNAKFLAEAGAALVVQEKDLADADLGNLILGLLRDKSRLAGMAKAARSLGHPDAARLVALEVANLASGRKHNGNRARATREGARSI